MILSTNRRPGDDLNRPWLTVARPDRDPVRLDRARFGIIAPVFVLRGPRAGLGLRAWAAALPAGLASYLDAATVTSVSLSLATWQKHFGLGVWQVGVLGAGTTLFVAVGALLGGRLGDRLGRVRVLNATLVVFVAGTLVILTASSGAGLTLGVVLVGLAAGADVPTSLSVIVDQAPPGARGQLIASTQVLWIAGILATFALGFAVSGLDYRGTQVLALHLVLVASITLGLRLAASHRHGGGGRLDSRATRTSRPLRLLDANALAALATTGGFFVLWNTAASTLGSYGSYFLVTRTGLDQRHATAVALLGFPPALVLAVVYARLADSVWRDRIFLVAMPLQVAGFALGAVTGGTVLWGMVGLVVLYGLSNVFAGEAAWKVWGQLVFPAEVRATAFGLTYGVARAVAACFLLVVPTLLAVRPAAVLWTLTVFVTLSGALGLVVVRHHGSARGS